MNNEEGWFLAIMKLFASITPLDYTRKHMSKKDYYPLQIHCNLIHSGMNNKPKKMKPKIKSAKDTTPE